MLLYLGNELESAFGLLGADGRTENSPIPCRRPSLTPLPRPKVFLSRRPRMLKMLGATRVLDSVSMAGAKAEGEEDGVKVPLTCPSSGMTRTV